MQTEDYGFHTNHDDEAEDEISRKRDREGGDTDEEGELFGDDGVSVYADAVEEELGQPDLQQHVAEEEAEVEAEVEAEAEAEVCDTYSAVETPRWQLGEGVFPLPPSDGSAAICGSWAGWDDEYNGGKLRAVRHLAIQRPLAFREDDGRLCSYKNFPDAETNVRSGALAALEGLIFDHQRKGHFVDGHGTILQEDQHLPDDEGKRAAAIPKIRVDSYHFDYCFRAASHQQSEAGGKTVEVEGAEHHDPAKQLPGSTVFRYVAPSCVQFVEIVYGPPTEDDDERGPPIGTRLHTFVFNPRHSVTAYVNTTMRESKAMRNHGRASMAPNRARGNSCGPEKAAKQQRRFIADPDNHRRGGMAFGRITGNGDLCDHVRVAAGQDSKRHERTPYGSAMEMANAVGTCAIDVETKPHPMLGSTHALSPEVMFNARRGADPPAELFPDAARSADPSNAYNPVLSAFMVTPDGMPIHVHPKQTNPNLYVDARGCITFPFPDAVQMLVRASENLLDSAMPHRLPMGVIIGDAALEAFWISNRGALLRLREAEAQVRFELEEQMVARGVPDAVRSRELQKRPNLRDMRNVLLCVFDENLRTDKEAVGVARTLNRSMIQHDSLDTAEGETASRRATCAQGESRERRTMLATEEASVQWKRVVNFCETARVLRLKRGDDPKVVAKWFNSASEEAMEWGVRGYFAIYRDVKYKARRWPKADEIVNSLDKFLRKAPDYFTHAKLDDDDPNRARGSINLAFGLNRERQRRGMTTYGEYLQFLAHTYSAVVGAHGRVMGARTMLHYASLMPATNNATGLKPVVCIHGLPGLNKSGICTRMAKIFNGEFDTELRRGWWSSSGDGSDQALRSGGLSNASGGVAYTDEALPAFVTGNGMRDGKMDAKMNDTKQLITLGETTRPRSYKVPGTDGGADQQVTIDDVTRFNVVFVAVSNLGANMVKSQGKGAPSVPDGDKRALIDRTISYPATEGTKLHCMSDSEFVTSMVEHRGDLLMHNLITTLTYIVCEIVSFVPEWQASNRSDARRMWAMFDTHLLDKFDIPEPEPRRVDLRETIGMIKSVESAVVRYVFCKEDAVAFNAMRPVSNPFDPDVDNPDDFKHVLSPFDYGQIKDIMKLIVYDHEVIVGAHTTAMFNNALATNPELYWSLVAVAKLHGTDPILDGKQLQPSDVSGDASSSVDMFGLPPRPESGQIPGFVDHSIETASNHFQLRRIVSRTFLARAAAMDGDVPSSRDGPTAESATFSDERTRAVLGSHSRDGVEYVTLVDDTVIPLKLAQDLLLPTSSDVLAAGYRSADLQNWLCGRESDTSFNAAEGETVFLGTASSGWHFRRNKNAPARTPSVYDAAWRTVPSATKTATTASTGDEPIQQPQGNAPLPSYEKELYEMSKKVIPLIDKFNLDPAHVYDRFIQLNLAKVQEYRLVQLSPDRIEDTTSVEEFRNDRGATFMRTLVDGVTEAAVSGQDIATVSKVALSITNLGTTTIRPIPLGAVAFRGTTGELQSRQARDWMDGETGATMMLADVSDSKNLYQRRLDGLVAGNWLPATVPLLSARVKRESPLMVEDQKPYFSSSFLHAHARLHVEIGRALARVPGLRVCSSGMKLGRKDDAPTPHQSPSLQSVQSVPQPTVVDAASRQRAIEEDFKRNKNLLASVSATVKRIIDEGRPKVTNLDIDECVKSLSFKIVPDSDRCFDELHVFLEMQLASLIDDNDAEVFEKLALKFPAVFRDADHLRSDVPDLTLSTAANEGDASESVKKHRGGPQLLSVAKTFKATTSTKSRKVAKLDTTFTARELQMIRSKYIKDTGIDPGMKPSSLRKIAAKTTTLSSVEHVDVRTRAGWRRSALRQKVKFGHIAENSANALQIMDIGIEAMRQVRVFYAKEPNAVCPSVDVGIQSAYLRPYKGSIAKGTCSEDEREMVEIFLEFELERQRPDMEDVDDEGEGEERRDDVNLDKL